MPLFKNAAVCGTPLPAAAVREDPPQGALVRGGHAVVAEDRRPPRPPRLLRHLPQLHAGPPYHRRRETHIICHCAIDGVICRKKWFQNFCL